MEVLCKSMAIHLVLLYTTQCYRWMWIFQLLDKVGKQNQWEIKYTYIFATAWNNKLWQNHFYYTPGYSIVLHWVPTMSYHFGASHIHRLSVAQATAGDISAPLNSIVWVERDACESPQLCISNHSPTPLRTRTPLHSIQQCKGAQRLSYF